MTSESRPRVVVVDDFYERPEEVRAAALETSFAREAWRPRICDWQESFDHGHDVEALMSRIGGILGRQLSFDPKLQGFFRLLSREAYIKLCRQDVVVHIDDYDWSGIVCLTPGYQGSIPLYEHKETGRVRLRGNMEWSEQLQRDSTDLDRWRLVDEIALRFNRLVLFDPRCFHFIAEGLGHGRETARLTQQFQFDEKALGPKVISSNW